MLNLLLIALFSFVGASPAFAASVSAPELDGSMMTGIVVGFTGLYAAVRFLKTRKK